MKKRLMRLFIILLIAAVAAEAALTAAVLINAKKPDEAERGDVMVILGARVWPNGHMSNVLKYRVDAAYDGYIRGLADNIIVCGARGSDEPDTEAAVMKRALIERGVPEENIFTEDKSVNTKENLKNAKAIMDGHGWKKAVIVTSDYHMARAKWLARDIGITDVSGIKAHPADHFGTRVKNILRETASWVFYVLRK